MNNILLVEDDKALSVGLVYSFNKEGYVIKHAVSLEEAREFLKKQSFDLAILDVGLPDGESFDLVTDIRKSENTPIIFLTARDEEDDLLRGFEEGGDDYMVKPFSLKELHARVKSLLKRNSYRKSDMRVSGDLRVDKQALKVYKFDKALDLTPSEFKLVNYFMDNYMVALTRDKLLEFLWDSDAEFSAYSTISVYINRLREKIEDDARAPKYIVTKRGIGYIWAMEVN